MGNDLIPTNASANVPKSSEPQRVAQRERLSVRVEAILGQFWRDEATAPVVQVLEIEGWLDVLEPLTEAEVRFAWAEYQRRGPRSRAGKLLRPDAGALYLIAMQARAPELDRARQRAIASLRRAEADEDTRRAADRPTPERSAEIIRSVGLRLNVGGK